MEEEEWGVFRGRLMRGRGAMIRTRMDNDCLFEREEEEDSKFREGR